MKSYNFVFILLISSCYSVDVNYYDDKNIEDKDYLNINQSNNRRFGQNPLDLVNLNLTNISSVQYKQSHLSINISKTQNLQSISNENPFVTKYDPLAKIIKNYSVAQNSSKYVSKFGVFKDYIYIYDDDGDSKILRYDNTSTPGKKEQSINNTEIPVKLKDHSIQFYNLEPAADRDILKDIQNDTADETVWYVPENYPCWELPLLYGELGQRKRTSKVFLIFGGRLKNVVDPGYNETICKSSNTPDDYISNRWCSVQPCYGDHTLCLFPDNDLSKLCEKGYKVEVPSILDQIALVNTINSMRNRVASGESERYSHLPSAANMKEINYDYDLQKVSEAWLRQCLPGPAPCSALDGDTVTHLECTKYADYCCFRSQSVFRCTPKTECFVSPIIGCLHIWFWSAGKNIEKDDIQCGRTSVKTFNTVQVLWAKTLKIGCAYGERSNGDIRVVCNFSPGAPFFLNTKLYCGIIAHSEKQLPDSISTKENFLSSLAVHWSHIEPTNKYVSKKNDQDIYSNIKAQDNVNTIWGVQSLNKIYEEGWVRKFLSQRKNGTKGMIARLVTKYIFVDESEARCDTNESIYIAGGAGSLCMDRGHRYKNLCYDFRDPTPGYRSVAVAAPIALFTLILYDLFSGVVRQTN